MNPILINIHNDITYLSFLDYVDIKSLCNSSKQLAYICKDNKILRSILYNKNENVEITPNLDISSALKDIYDSIQKIIDVNYPEESLPCWINKKLFNDDMLRKLMYNFLEIIVDEITDIYAENKQPLREITKIELYKPLVASVLYSNDIDFDDFSGIKSDIPQTIIIPKSFYQYITHTVNKLAKYVEAEDIDHNIYDYYDLDYRVLLKALSDLLFVK